MKTRRAYKAGAAAPQIGLELELSSWSERLESGWLAALDRPSMLVHMSDKAALGADHRRRGGTLRRMGLRHPEMIRGDRRMEPNTLMDLGGGVGWLGTLLIGGLAGWIAGKITKTEMGVIMNIIVGIIGAYIGAFLANLLGLKLGEFFHGWFWGNLIVSIVGAVILIAAVRAVRRSA
jgi:uncharacterized membrane protein YeaQ/YmgE (transglycosylase-associated protein family)